MTDVPARDAVGHDMPKAVCDAHGHGAKHELLLVNAYIILDEHTIEMPARADQDSGVTTSAS